MELTQLQTEVNAWAKANFGESKPPHCGALHGTTEELGELCSVLAGELLQLYPVLMMAQALGNANRAHLKGVQGIRGSSAEHEAKLKDAIGDIVIFLCNYCGNKGWDLQTIAKETWVGVVEKRNWKKNPTTGTTGNPEKALELFKAAAERFVAKVESGAARSVETYADMKEALAVLDGEN